MLKKERQINFLNKCCKTIKSCIHTFCQTTEPEELHRLRVEFKKIYAWVHLMEACRKKNKLSYRQKSFKKIFKNAGNIRSAQVNLQLIGNNLPEGEAYKEEQNNIIQEASALFCSKIKIYQINIKKSRKKLLKKTTSIKNKSVLAYYQYQIALLGLFFSLDFKPEELHEVRKKIKDIMYVHAFLPAHLVHELKINISFLHELQNSIGQWHDSVLSAELLKANNVAQDAVIKLQQQSQHILHTINLMTANFSSKILLENDGEMKVAG